MKDPEDTNILIVDDEPNILKLIKMTLKAEGYNTWTANDALQALEVLERQYIDLVITDLRMPKMDGIQLLEEINNRWGAKLIPVLIITAQGDEKSAYKAGMMNAAGWIAKPFQPKEKLIQDVKGVLRRREVELENSRLIRRLRELETGKLGRKKTLVYMDDDLMSHLHIGSRLNHENYNVLLCSNVDEVFDIVKQTEFITDYIVINNHKQSEIEDFQSIDSIGKNMAIEEFIRRVQDIDKDIHIILVCDESSCEQPKESGSIQKVKGPISYQELRVAIRIAQTHPTGREETIKKIGGDGNGN